MKAFATWLAITLATFAGLGGGYHVALTASPRKILVIVDTSYPMKDDWRRVPGIVREIEARPYAEFGLATEKSQVHDWGPRIRLGQLTPYAPRNFDKLESGSVFPAIGDATDVYLVTNAPDSELEGLGGWIVVRP